ncbi:MAG: PA14 domain-containing protein, partial [Acidimicrobiales bacterium]
MPATAAAGVAGAQSMATVEVGVDPAWLGDGARAWPVTIDPTFNTVSPNTATAGTDTLVWAGAPTTAFAANTYLETGRWSPTVAPPGGVSRSFLRFDLGVTPAANVWVTESHLRIDQYVAIDCVARPVQVTGLGAAFSAATTWNNQPGVDGSGVVSTTSFSHGATGCPEGWDNLDTTGLAQRWLHDGAANNGLRIAAADETDTNAAKAYRSGEAGASLAPTLYVTYNHLPDMATPAAAAPPDGAVLGTPTPTLAVNAATDPDGQAVKYWFRITTNPDAETGPKIDSGWTDATSWAPPAGALVDGGTYWWHTWTSDGTSVAWDGSHYTVPNWSRGFRLDLHLGASGPTPHDDMGPVRVDLANGNVSLSAASPALATVGGNVGVSYAYNAGALTAGLSASYYDDTNANRLFDEAPVAQRVDTTINHYWGTGPVGPAGADNALVRWSGFLAAPVSGDYTLPVWSDDGVRVWVNNALVLDRWYDQHTWPNQVYTSSVHLSAGVPVPFKVEYYEASGEAQVTLGLHGPLGPGGAVAETLLDPSWLSPDAPVLPSGWALVAGAASLAFRSASVAESSVTLTDAGGGSHTWRRLAGTGGYVPPDGEDGVLARDGAGNLTLHGDDAVTYVFDPGGRLASATTATDDRSPAAAAYT